MIYFVVRNISFGGIQQVNVRLAESLKKKGIDCELLVFKRNKSEFETTVPVRELGALIFSQEDIVFTNNGRDIFYLFRRYHKSLKNTRIFHIQHTELNPSIKNPFFRIVQLLLFHLIIYRAEKIIFVGNELRDHFVSRIGAIKRKSVVIFNPLMPRSEYSPRFFENRIPKRILHVGRISYQKDQERMLAIFNAYVRRPDAVEDSKLTFVGAGDSSSLQRLAKSLGIAERVCFLGHRDDIAELMASHDVLCLTSRWEGYPTVLVEALFYCPRVFATKCHFGVSEAISAARGYLSDAFDHSRAAIELADCLRQKPVNTDQRDTEPYFYEAAADSYEALIEGTFIDSSVGQ